MQKEKVLVCFTASYPYGKRETYFNTELEYLASAFKHVYLVPTYNPTKSNDKRTVPANVTVLKPISQQGVKRFIQAIVSPAPTGVFIKEFFAKSLYLKKTHFLNWLNSLLVFKIKYQKTKKFLGTLNENHSNIILYSYWGSGIILTTTFFKPFKKIMRMHGGDFYLNRNHGYLPLREILYPSIDLLLPISNDIASILTNHYGVAKQKIFVNYLGVKATGAINPPIQPIIRVVSCSNLVALKRVELIAETMINWSTPVTIEWHHFGTGPEEEKLLALIGTNKNSYAHFFFHGWKTTPEIYEFYAANYITCFINVSRFEGVPVSIMEAFAFGIPAIATNVGATNEIVNNTNGYLIPIDFSFSMLEEKILSIKRDETESLDKRKSAFKTWQENFNASTNYNTLIQRLNQI